MREMLEASGAGRKDSQPSVVHQEVNFIRKIEEIVHQE